MPDNPTHQYARAIVKFDNDGTYKPEKRYVRDIAVGVQEYRRGQWSTDEDQFLKDNPIAAQKTLCRFLPNRSRLSIKRRRSQLGLPSLRPTYRLWKTNELNLLKESVSLSWGECAKMLGRTHRSVRKFAERQGVRKQEKKQSVTKKVGSTTEFGITIVSIESKLAAGWNVMAHCHCGNAFVFASQRTSRVRSCGCLNGLRWPGPKFSFKRCRTEAHAKRLSENKRYRHAKNPHRDRLTTPKIPATVIKIGSTP